MRGQVERLNHERAVAAIRTGPNDYTVVEFHDGTGVFPEATEANVARARELLTKK